MRPLKGGRTPVTINQQEGQEMDSFAVAFGMIMNSITVASLVLNGLLARDLSKTKKELASFQ